MMKSYNPLIQWAAQKFLGTFDEKLFVNHTVHEYLFGFKEPTMEAINKFTMKHFHKKFSYFENDTFGLFYGVST